MKNFSRYHDAVNYIEGLSNLPLAGDYMIDAASADIYLKRMRYFLNLLGNPDQNLSYIHVTGTAGKGSVTNALHQVLFASGKKVGSYTSPFTITSIEKIRVNDRYISPAEFADIVDYLKPFIDTAYIHGPYGRPSYFEIFLAICLLYFKQQQCEWVVLEVGCGGRYDATNVIKNPACTVITGIDYDHTHILGKSLKKIAYDKAGIIKPGSAFFTAEKRPALLSIFASICQAQKVPMIQVPAQTNYRQSNEALVRAVSTYLALPNKAVEKGMARSKLPCRFEIMQSGPLVVLDGAHNRAKIRSTVANLKALTYKRLHLIFALSENKDDAKIIPELIPLADELYITRFQLSGRQCAHPKQLSKKVAQYKKSKAKPKVFLDPRQALAEAISQSGKDDLILVAGSFYLSGELRRHWCSEDWILTHRRSFRP